MESLTRNESQPRGHEADKKTPRQSRAVLLRRRDPWLAFASTSSSLLFGHLRGAEKCDRFLEHINEAPCAQAECRVI